MIGQGMLCAVFNRAGHPVLSKNRAGGKRMADTRKLIGGRPVIGIRPVIDGRKGPLDVRGSLEEQTM